MRAWTNALAGWAALAVAMGVGRFAFTPILPMMQEDFGLSVADAGWLAAANYAGYLAGALAAIRVRIQATAAVRFGLLAIGVSTLAAGLTSDFLLLAVLRAVAGVASAAVQVFVSAWTLERLSLAGRADLGGVVYAGVGTGIVVAGATCLVVMGMHAGSVDAWLALGLLAVVVTAAIWPLFEAGPKSSAGPAAAIRWGANDLRLILCYGAYGFGYIVPATFLPAMAKTIVPDPSQFGWAWPMFGAAALVSTLFAARLAQMLSHRTIWICGYYVMALGVVIPLAAPGLPGVMFAALLVGGTFMVITMAGMQEARRVAGPHARALMAAMTSAFALGQILGPVLVSFLSRSSGGIAPALVLAAALLVLSAISLRHPGETT